MIYATPEGLLHCPGCDRDYRSIDAFHARDCTNKQTTMEAFV